MLFDYNKHDDYEPKERDDRHPRLRGKFHDFMSWVIMLALLYQLGEWVVSFVTEKLLSTK